MLEARTGINVTMPAVARSIGEIEIIARLVNPTAPIVHAESGAAAWWWRAYQQRFADERAARLIEITRYADGFAMVPAPYAAGTAEFGTVAAAAVIAPRIFGRSDALALTPDERDIEVLAASGWFDWLMAA
jgi:hypothetical protein